MSRQRDKKDLKTGDSFSGLCSSGVPLVAIKYRAYKQHSSSSVGCLHTNTSTRYNPDFSITDMSKRFNQTMALE